MLTIRNLIIFGRSVGINIFEFGLFDEMRLAFEEFNKLKYNETTLQTCEHEREGSLFKYEVV